MSLEIGQQAPDFKTQDQEGDAISLSDFKGKKVVLYFYPKNNTPGCTAQACNLRDNYEALQKAGYVVLGISSDSQKSHKKFVEKQNLPFPLLVDEDLAIHEKYGTWVEKQMFGRKYMGTARTTFVIDEEGLIEDIITKVKTKEHSSQILK
jgi:peroxiredoxin Q/BCP